MADISWMARMGARLVTNGYAILPIAPGTKKPGQFARAAWHDYPQWNRHASRATTEIEVTTWSTWPDCGVGIVGGAVAALDIDIAEDGELALRIERLARERLGDTPALRIGKPPKRLLVYRTREPFAGIRRAPLEMLCLGQQFVAYAKHPDTGQPYAWPDEGLADLDIESLPEIDAEQAAAFLDEALTLIPPELRPKSLGAKGANGAGHPCCAIRIFFGDIMPSTREATLAALHARLLALPATALRGEVLPERVPAEGLLILRDGEPGEPEVTLSPLRYHYQHRAEIEAVVQGAARDAAFDTLTASIGAALAADRTLGGLCDWVEAEAPRPVDLPVEGAASLKAAVIPVVLHYSTADPLA